MNKSILLMPILLAGLAKSQEGRVGINTVSPKTTLDVNGKSDTNGLSLSGDITGLQAPRLTRAELTNKGNTLYGADQRGAIVYITDVSGGNNVSQRVNITSVGYYYFDGTVWNRIASNSGAILNPITSDNGLTKTGDNIQLGGTLIKDTDIATAGFNTTFSGAGKVGIGTNVPSNLLTINKDGITSGITTSFVDGITLTSNMNSTGLSGPGLYFEGANGPVGEKVLKLNYSKNISDQSFLNFQAVSDDASGSSNTVMSMFHNGKIGVGNTDPTEQFDVNGNVRFRSVPSSSGVASGESIMVLQADGTAKKIPLSVLQQSLSKLYYKYYIFQRNGDDFVQNFDTKIPSDKYTVLITGFDTNLTGGGVGFVKSSGSNFDFQTPNIVAFTESNTWRIKVDVPNASVNVATMAWGIRVLIVSNDQVTNLSSGTFNLGTSITGSDTASPVP